MPRVSTARIISETAITYEGNLTLKELIVAHLRALLSDPTAVTTVNVRYTNHKLRKEYQEAMQEIVAQGGPGVPREPGQVMNLADLNGVQIPGVDKPVARVQHEGPVGVEAIKEALEGDDPDLRAVAENLAVTLVGPSPDLTPVEIEEAPGNSFEDVVEPPSEDRNAPLVGTSDLDWLDRLGFPDDPVSDQVKEEQAPPQ